MNLNRVIRWVALVLLGAADVALVAVCAPVIPAADQDGRTGVIVVGVLALVVLGGAGIVMDSLDAAAGR